MTSGLRHIVAGLIGSILVVVVALENRQTVQIHLYFWRLPHVPLVLVVLVAMLIGLLIGVVSMWWEHRSCTSLSRPLHKTSSPASNDVPKPK